MPPAGAPRIRHLPAMAAAPDPYQPPVPRRLPPGFRAVGWSRLEPLYAELLARPLDAPAALEEWLLDWSEVDAAVTAEAARRQVANARDTGDREAERHHLEFQEEVLPRVKEVGDRLDRRYLECPARRALDRRRWEVFDRDTALAVELFRAENLPLEVEEERQAIAYFRVTGAMTVEYRGRTWTLPALGPLHEDPDRAVREEVWRLAAARRLQDQDALEECFEALLDLRVRMARNAGFANYRDFQHRRSGRHDYTPADCLALHEAIRRHVLPVLAVMREERRRRLGLAALRPWDLAVDPSGRPPFEPFQDQAGQVALAAAVLERVDPAIARDLRWLEERGHLDLETRPDKQPGGFQTTFEDVRLPFIFANSGTTQGDLETLVHEAGHAFHTLRCRELEPLAYRDAPLEFAEVASMGLEALATEHWHEVHPPGEAARAVRDALEDVVAGLPWIALVDAFQHRLYLEPDLGRQGRRALWVELAASFLPGVEWRGLEEERACGWHGQLHIFEAPFYYVEYALAQIGALQLWFRYRQDPGAALAAWRAALALGGSRPLPELYAAAGLRFDPRGETLAELMPRLLEAWREVLAREAEAA